MMRKITNFNACLLFVICNLLFTSTTFAQTLGPNLISNPSFESSPTTPTGWSKGGYGTNTRILDFPVPGSAGANGARVRVTNYTSGDAKWYFNHVSVQPGRTYRFADDYKSDVASIVDVQFKLSDGSFIYKDILVLPPSAAYKRATAEFTVPANVVSVTVFHLLNQVGTLDTDNYSLNEVLSAPPPPPPSPGNLISNGNFESESSGVPANWSKGRWGTNNTVFIYPDSGVSGSKAAGINITSYTSGDAKWYFKPLALSSGTYTYSDEYKSSAQTTITVQIRNADGTTTFKDLKILPASGSFTKTSVDFFVPAAVSDVTVFHLLNRVGTLTIDNASLVKKSSSALTVAVSLTFDDGWLSQYQNALPKLNQAGKKGVFYITTQRMADQGYPGYISIAQLRQIYNAGHEIGAHTRTHPALSQLSSAEQQNEIQGSRNDLLALNIGPIMSFAYPFGDYNNTTISIVKNAGFSSARTTNSGNANPGSDPHLLPRRPVNVDTTFAQVKSWIDGAVASKEWLILVFHEVNTSGHFYSTTPQTFNQIVDYLVSNNIRVITVTEGLSNL